MTILSRIRKILNDPNGQVLAVGERPWAQRVLKTLTTGLAVSALYAAALTPGNLLSEDHQSAKLSVAEILKQPGEFTPAPMSAFMLKLQALGEPTEPTSAAAKIAVTPEMSNQQIASQLLTEGHHFQALAVTLESLETRPYRDGCGLNVGMGYCINARVREHGVDQVKNDLLSAGIKAEDVTTLMGNDKKAQSRVELTKTQALSLLSITEDGYRTRVRDIVGPQVFDKLQPNQKGVLTWLGYNAGDGLSKFNQLLSAVRQSNKVEAVKHMTPFFSQQGKMVPNARAGSWLMAAYWSEDAMKSAINNPDALEFNARNGKSPLAVVVPQEAKLLAGKNLLPSSPYVFHADRLNGLATPAPAAMVATNEAPAQLPEAKVSRNTPDAPMAASTPERVSAPDENGVRWRQVTIQIPRGNNSNVSPEQRTQQSEDLDKAFNNWQNRRQQNRQAETQPQQDYQPNPYQRRR